MKNPLKAVIFDLGRVVLDFDHWIGVNKIASLSKKTPQEIFDFFFDSKLTQKFESGKVTPENFFRRVKKDLHLKIKYKEFLPIWSEIFIFTDNNKEVYSIAKGLKGKYKTAILSNINELHLEYIERTFPVFDAFDRVFASCRMGAIKPERKIYIEALKALEALPNETFYVDDRPELVKQARRLGIRAFVFTGVGQLKEDLASCGVLL